MYLTKKDQEAIEGLIKGLGEFRVSSFFSPNCLNIVRENNDPRGESHFSLRLSTHRAKDGIIEVRESLQHAFTGNLGEHVLHTVKVVRAHDELAALKGAVVQYLQGNQRKCPLLSYTQAGTVSHMAMEFPGWREPPEVFTARTGATFMDGDFSFDNPNLGEQEMGQIWVDPMPGGHIQVMFEGGYVLPLAERVNDYLRAEGFTVELAMRSMDNPFAGSLSD